MNDIVGLWLLSLPLFILIFLEKCVDFHSYRRKLHVKKVSNYLILDLLIIEASQLLVVRIEYSILYSKLLSILLPLFVTLLFLILTLFFLYWIERKRITIVSQQATLVKKSLKINLMVTCAFTILYRLITIGNIIYFADSEMIMWGEVRKYTLSKGDYIHIVITVLLLLSAIWLKVRSQKAVSYRT